MAGEVEEVPRCSSLNPSGGWGGEQGARAGDGQCTQSLPGGGREAVSTSKTGGCPEFFYCKGGPCTDEGSMLFERLWELVYVPSVNVEQLQHIVNSKNVVCYNWGSRTCSSYFRCQEWPMVM